MGLADIQNEQMCSHVDDEMHNKDVYDKHTGSYVILCLYW